MTMQLGVDAQWMMPPASSDGTMADLLARVVDVGLDWVGVGDHISFRDGTGFDAAVNATALLASHPTVRVLAGAYLLPARHPVVVARQLSSIARFAPGRLALAIGVGGEDPNEFRIVGVDPGTRGARADESLAVLRRLLTGERVDHDGRFYEMERAVISPPPDPPIPLLVAGRSDAALRRCAALGDGWLAIWVSADRLRSSVDQITEYSAQLGRAEPPTDHGINVWCAFDDDGVTGADRLSDVMEQFYGLPFDRFRKWCPTGRPEDIARFVADYAGTGCRRVVLVPAAMDPHRTIALVGEVGEHLRAMGVLSAQGEEPSQARRH